MNESKIINEKQKMEYILPNSTSMLNRRSQDNENFRILQNIPKQMQLCQEISKTPLKKSTIVISTADRNLYSDQLFDFRVRLYPEAPGNFNDRNEIGIFTQRKYQNIYQINVIRIIAPRISVFTYGLYQNPENLSTKEYHYVDKEILKISIDNASKSELLDGSGIELRKISQYMIKDTSNDFSISYVPVNYHTNNKFTNNNNAFRLSVSSQSFLDYFTSTKTFENGGEIFNKIFLPFFRNDFSDAVNELSSQEMKTSNNVNTKVLYQIENDIETFFDTNSSFDPRMFYFDIYVIRSLSFLPYRGKFLVELDISYPYNYIRINDALIFRNCFLTPTEITNAPIHLRDIYIGINDMIFNSSLSSDCALRFLVTDLFNESMETIFNELGVITSYDHRIRYIELLFPSMITTSANNVYSFRNLLFSSQEESINTQILIFRRDQYSNNLKHDIYPASFRKYPFLLNISLQMEYVLEVVEEEEYFIKNVNN